MAKVTQITLTGRNERDFKMLKKKLEIDVGLPLSNVQVVQYLIGRYAHKDTIEG